MILTPVGGGAPLMVATTGDGGYELAGVPPGDYTLAVVAPDGFTAPAPVAVTVPAGGLAGQDLALSRLGTAGGTVTLDGAPVAGVKVVVEGPGGRLVALTDADGGWYVEDLGPGTWTASPAPPPGTVVTGVPSASFPISSGGEARGGRDFALVTAPAPTSSPTTTPTVTPTVTPTPTPTPTPTATPSPTSTTTPSPSPSPTPGGDGGGSSGGPTGDPEQGQPVLPDAGGPSPWLPAASLGCVALGAVLLRVSRRRSRP